MVQTVKINPMRCRVWDLHGRIEEYISETSCGDEIQSIKEHGQLIPAIGRPIRDDSTCEVEIICGARRLFAARYLGMPLTVEIRELTDREAIVVIDIENRQRRDWCAYEQGRSFAKWLRLGHFASQDELSKALNISASQVSRLMKIARLPTVVVEAFADPSEISETWGLALAAACDNVETRHRVIAKARTLGGVTGPKASARDTFDHLILDKKTRVALRRHRYEVVTGRSGQPLCRIRHQNGSVAVFIDKQHLSSASLELIKVALAQILQNASSQPIVLPRNVSVLERSVGPIALTGIR